MDGLVLGYLLPNYSQQFALCADFQQVNLKPLPRLLEYLGLLKVLL